MALVDDHFDSWKEQQFAAEQIIPLAGQLYRDYGINIRIFGRRLLNNSAIEILKAHRYAVQIVGRELDVTKSLELLQVMTEMDLAASRVDLGKLCHRYMDEGGDAASFLKQQLAAINTGKSTILEEPQDVVLYGFGRIGRLLARLLIDRVGAGNKMRLRAIVVRGGKDGDLRKRASLLRRDSIHGAFNGSIKVMRKRTRLSLMATISR